MRSIRWRRGLLLALLPLMLTVGGCTGSDPLPPQSQTYAVTVGSINPDETYDVTAYQLDQFVVLPTDPDAQQSLTQIADGLNLLRLPIEYLSISPEVTVRLALSNGSYVVDQLTLSNIQLFDTVPPRAPPLVYFPAVLITAADLGNPVLFRAENGGTNHLVFAIDSTEFVAAFQAAQANPNPTFAEALAAQASQYLFIQ